MAAFGEVSKWGSQHQVLPSPLPDGHKQIPALWWEMTNFLEHLSNSFPSFSLAVVDSYRNLLVATKSCLPCFSKSLFMFMLPFVSVSLWYSNSNTECTLEYCPWRRRILFSLLTLIENLVRLSPVFITLLQDTGNPENPRKMQWCGAIMVVTDSVEVTDCTAQESLWFSYLK